MKEREALKLALEALKLNNRGWKALADSGDSGQWSAEDKDHYHQTEQAIIAIEEALAQPEKEPVAWQWLTTAHFRKKLPKDAELGAWNPLYTTPPQPKESEQEPVAWLDPNQTIDSYAMSWYQNETHNVPLFKGKTK